jgi:hypothetical protein
MIGFEYGWKKGPRRPAQPLFWAQYRALRSEALMGAAAAVLESPTLEPVVAARVEKLYDEYRDYLARMVEWHRASYLADLHPLGALWARLTGKATRVADVRALVCRVDELLWETAMLQELLERYGPKEVPRGFRVEITDDGEAFDWNDRDNRDEVRKRRKRESH